MFTMDTVVSVTAKAVQVNTEQVHHSDALIVVKAADELLLEVWTTEVPDATR